MSRPAARDSVDCRIFGKAAFRSICVCRCDRPQRFETNQLALELAGNDEVIARSLFTPVARQLSGTVPASQPRQTAP